MWTIVLAAAVAVTSVVTGEAGVLYATAPQDRGQYHKSSGGSYNYGYNTGDGVAKVEVKRPDGSVVGSYRYFDPNGRQIVRSYVADSKGFRILGNDLPISPETPAANIIGAPALTAPVEGAHQAVVDAALHPTKRQNTIDIEQFTNLQLLRHRDHHQIVLDQQNAILLQQQQLINQQKLELAALRNQKVELKSADTNEATVRQDIVQVSPPEIVEYSTVEGETPYYYYPHKYDYDFPAGFAYSGRPVLRVAQPPTVVGVRGIDHEANRITVGRRRVVLPAPWPPIEVVSRTNVPYQRPYVIGRMK